MPRKPSKQLASAWAELQKIVFVVMPLGRFGLVVEGEKPSASVERIVQAYSVLRQETHLLVTRMHEATVISNNLRHELRDPQ